MSSKGEVGRLGEQCIHDFLLRHGYQIVKRNYRTIYGEVDIIAKKERVLYLVEVKSRSNQNSGFPEEQISRKKLQHMARCASYIKRYFDHEGRVEICVGVVEFESLKPIIVKRVAFYTGEMILL